MLTVQNSCMTKKSGKMVSIFSMNYQLIVIFQQMTVCNNWKLWVVDLIPSSRIAFRRTCAQRSLRKSRPVNKQLISDRDYSMRIWRRLEMIITLMSQTWRRARSSRGKAATFLLQIRRFRVRATKTTQKVTSAQARSRHLSVNSWRTSSHRVTQRRRFTRTSRKWTRSTRIWTKNKSKKLLHSPSKLEHWNSLNKSKVSNSAMRTTFSMMKKYLNRINKSLPS